MFGKGFCKVYVECQLSPKELAREIGRTMSGTVDGYSVTTDALTLDVMANDETCDRFEGHELDDFLYFPLFLDILPLQSTVTDAYVGQVSVILTYLWDKGYRAIAACQFEDRLPRAGGKLQP